MTCSTCSTQAAPATSRGFYVGDERRVHAIPRSTRPLSSSASGPAQISFNIFGDVLVVTEKMTNKIVLYDVVDGYAQAPQVRDSSRHDAFRIRLRPA